MPGNKQRFIIIFQENVFYKLLLFLYEQVAYSFVLPVAVAVPVAVPVAVAAPAPVYQSGYSYGYSSGYSSGGYGGYGGGLGHKRRLGSRTVVRHRQFG